MASLVSDLMVRLRWVLLRFFHFLSIFVFPEMLVRCCAVILYFYVILMMFEFDLCNVCVCVCARVTCGERSLCVFSCARVLRPKAVILSGVLRPSFFGTCSAWAVSVLVPSWVLSFAGLCSF